MPSTALERKIRFFFYDFQSNASEQLVIFGLNCFVLDRIK